MTQSVPSAFRAGKLTLGLCQFCIDGAPNFGAGMSFLDPTTRFASTSDEGGWARGAAGGVGLVVGGRTLGFQISHPYHTKSGPSLDISCEQNFRDVIFA